MKMAPASARQDDTLSGREATRDFLACFAFPAGLDASVDESSGTATHDKPHLLWTGIGGPFDLSPALSQEAWQDPLACLCIP